LLSFISVYFSIIKSQIHLISQSSFIFQFLKVVKIILSSHLVKVQLIILSSSHCLSLQLYGICLRPSYHFNDKSSAIFRHLQLVVSVIVLFLILIPLSQYPVQVLNVWTDKLQAISFILSSTQNLSNIFFTSSSYLSKSSNSPSVLWWLLFLNFGSFKSFSSIWNLWNDLSCFAFYHFRIIIKWAKSIIIKLSW